MIKYISERISSREREVLQCLADGLTTDETANRLFISHDTVKTHRKNLLIKMEAKNAFQLGVKATAFKLIGYYALAE